MSRLTPTYRIVLNSARGEREATVTPSISTLHLDPHLFRSVPPRHCGTDAGFSLAHGKPLVNADALPVPAVLLACTLQIGAINLAFGEIADVTILFPALPALIR